MTVDDAGLHPAVARAVEILSEKGVVTSASLVATGADVVQAAALAGVGLGVHLDILRGRPLVHWQEVNTMVDQNGAFLLDPVLLFERYAKGKVDHEQVEREWAAQIERVLDLGVRPTHLSSHKHVHGWPTLTKLAGDLARRYGIGWVRKPIECAEVARLDTTGMQAQFLGLCNLFERETDGVRWPDMVWDVHDSEIPFDPSAFSRFMRRFGPGEVGDEVVEVRCLPGVTVAGDPVIEKGIGSTELAAIWRTEFQSLAEDGWTEVFNEHGLTLSGFGRLAERMGKTP